MVSADYLSRAFNGRRVLVTGHTGFKGAWLTSWLLQMGAKVSGYALPPVGDNNLFDQLGLSQQIDHEENDIRDHEHLMAHVRAFEPEVVFHLAAQALVRRSYKDPKESFDTNVAGSVNVLEACRACESIKALVYVTSDKCYRNKEWIWGYRENDELGGHDPYSASKAAAELVFSSYLDCFFRERPQFGAASVRAGNVIGGGDWAEDRIIPDCIRALRDGKPIELRNPDSTRPWQHVLEPLSGYLLVAAKLLESPHVYEGAWNFGPNTHSVKTVGELADMIVAANGEGEVRRVPQGNAPHEARLLYLNCDKAQQQLGWWPRWSAEQAIQETIEWYRQVKGPQTAVEITRAQIEKYLEVK